MEVLMKELNIAQMEQIEGGGGNVNWCSVAVVAGMGLIYTGLFISGPAGWFLGSFFALGGLNGLEKCSS
jgi:bacteriocin-like protein